MVRGVKTSLYFYTAKLTWDNMHLITIVFTDLRNFMRKNFE